MIRANVFVRRLAALAAQHGGPGRAALAAPAAPPPSASRAPSRAPAAALRARATPPSAPSARRASSAAAAAATELGSILTREIEEEADGAAPGGLPDALAALDADVRRRWTVVEGLAGLGAAAQTGSGAAVRMLRKEAGSGGARIGIAFHCQDTEDDGTFDEAAFLAGHEEGGAGGGAEGAGGEEPAQAVRFGVTASKGGRTVVLQCRAGAEGAVHVEGVTVRDGDAEGVLAALAGRENAHAALYQGPDFAELSEDLQEAFQTYVTRECGVDEDVAAYIAMYADHREQEEYVAWLKTAVEILD